MCNLSPILRRGGWPRSVEYDRSGAVVFSADPKVDTAAITSVGSDVVVIVPAGRSWNDRAPRITFVLSSRLTYVCSPSEKICTWLSTQAYTFKGPDRSIVYSSDWKVSCSPGLTLAIIIPFESRTRTLSVDGSLIESAVNCTTEPTGNPFDQQTLTRAKPVRSSSTDTGVVRSDRLSRARQLSARTSALLSRMCESYGFCAIDRGASRDRIYGPFSAIDRYSESTGSQPEL